MEDLQNILFLDIETVALSESHALLDERSKAHWARKANFFRQRDPSLSEEGLYRDRAGIYAEFGKIIVIAIGRFITDENGNRTLKTRAFANHDELTLLQEFRGALEKMDQSRLRFCAHNGKEFDFPYLSRRMLVHGIPLPESLSLSGRKPWEIPHLDTLEMWKFGDYKHYTSLDLLTTVFNIPTSKGDMDGSQVNEVYYREKDLRKIVEYCVGDVIAVAQLFLRLRGCPMIETNKIIAS